MVPVCLLLLKFVVFVGLLLRLSIACRSPLALDPRSSLALSLARPLARVSLARPLGNSIKRPINGMVTPGELPLDPSKPIVSLFVAPFGSIAPLVTYYPALCQIPTLEIAWGPRYNKP